MPFIDEYTLLKPAEVATLLGVSPGQVGALRRAGKLEGILQPGGRNYLFPPENVEQLLERRRAGER